MAYPKTPPRPGLYPVPPFAGWATVTGRRYPRLDGSVLPFVCVLGLYNRKLEVIQTAAWGDQNPFSVDPGTGLFRSIGNFCKLNCDEQAVPNGAEWWALAAPSPLGFPPFQDPQPIAPFDPFFRVRWRLHV